MDREDGEREREKGKNRLKSTHEMSDEDHERFSQPQEQVAVEYFQIGRQDESRANLVPAGRTLKASITHVVSADSNETRLRPICL